MTEPLLQLESVGVDHVISHGWRRVRLRAVADVSFDLPAGGTLGIVGESGSGKSSLVQAVLGLLPAAAGAIRWRGSGLAPSGERSPAFRRSVQLVFQAPYDSLDPRYPIAGTVGEPLAALRPELDGGERRRRVAAALEEVGLGPALAMRRPGELSLGQCQRVGIARALVVEPELIVCDEPVSALDVSMQAQVLNLLGRLRRDRGLALLLIGHDLAVVRLLCERLLVMYLGRVVESGPRDALFAAPRHPYTRTLLAAVVEPPVIRAARSTPPSPQWRAGVAGEQPSPAEPPPGCVFHPRCLHATSLCRERIPVQEQTADGRSVACHHWRSIAGMRIG